MTRTDHRSSQVVALYRRHARTAAEAKLGWFLSLHEVILELAALEDVGEEASSGRRTNR